MEAINWDAVSAISEALGLIVVVASLIFVGFQIRQNTQATKVSAIQNITSDIRGFNFEVGNNAEFAEIFFKGSIHPGTLDTVDLFRYNNIMTGTFQAFLNMFYQLNQGTFDEKNFESYQRYLRSICGCPGAQDYWSTRYKYFPEDFQQYINEEIIGKADEAAYRQYAEAGT